MAVPTSLLPDGARGLVFGKCYTRHLQKAIVAAAANNPLLSNQQTIVAWLGRREVRCHQCPNGLVCAGHPIFGCSG